MTAPASYENDYLRWLDAQAQHLRAGELDQLDRAHLLEELEGMSRSERRQLRNRLVVLLMHLLRMRHQPGRHARSWEVTVITQRVDIKLLLRESPSLRPTLAATLEAAYRAARREAAQGDRARQRPPSGDLSLHAGAGTGRGLVAGRRRRLLTPRRPAAAGHQAKTMVLLPCSSTRSSR